MAEKTILIADDNPEIVKALSIQLKRVGYKVQVAEDSLRAMMYTRRNPPDLIILDIKMPAGGGTFVLENLKKNPETMGVPVIVLTAFGDAKERAEQLGAFRFFNKPHDSDELLKAIEEAIGPGERSS